MKISMMTLAALTVFAAMTGWTDVPSVTPVDKCDKIWWAKRHEALKSKAAKGGYEVVFLGDSITHFWAKSGKAVWAENFAEGKYRALNCGFAGDTTENLLWRIDNGELDGLDPKAFVLLIGTNNTGHRDVRAEPPLDTVLGVKAAIDRLRVKFPEAKVILHPLLPRGAKPDNTVQTRNDAVNRALFFLADGTNVLWCNFNGRLTKDGWIGKDLFPDLLHPAGEGYRIWAAALKPFLDFAIDGGERAPITPRPKWLTGPHATTPQVSPRWFKAGKERRYLVKRNELAANAGRDYDLVMIGDSITHRWESESERNGGLGVFRERFAGRRVLNLGFGGDGTQSILWAIRYGGVLDGYSTRFVTLLIGTNNIKNGTPEEVAEGIRLILEEIRTRQPQARIALMPLLPRGWPRRLGSDAPLANIPKINELIAPYADGDRVVWLDLRAKFLGPNGRLNPKLYSDHTHPNADGYRIWADALLPLLGAAAPAAAAGGKSVRSSRYILAVPKAEIPIEITKEMWIGRCVLKGNRVPFEEVDDHSFTDAVLKDVRIVFMGKRLKPAPESAAALARFEKRGGAIVRFNRYEFKTADVLYERVRKAAPDDAAFWDGLKAKNARIRAEELKEIAKMPGKAGEIRRMSFHDAKWKQKIDGEDWSWDRAIGCARDYGFNVAVCYPAYPNYAYYRSKVFPVGSAIDSEGDVIEAFVAACRKHGVKSCVSVRCFKAKVDKQLPEPYLAEWTRRAAEPGVMAVSRTGKVHAGALCPANPDTRRRLVEGVLEIAAYGVDQISLDFVRFIDNNHCFCARCKAGIAAAGGDEERYRRETVTSVVREIRAALKAKFPKVELAASVFQNPDAFAARIGQPWDKWCEEGLLDEANPMDYLLEPEDFEKLVRQQVPRQTHGLRTVPIFGPNLWPDDGHMEMRAAEMIRRVRTVDGTAGFSLFLFERRMLNILDALKDGPLRQNR